MMSTVKSLPCWFCGSQVKLTANRLSALLEQKALPLCGDCRKFQDFLDDELPQAVLDALLCSPDAIEALARLTPEEFKRRCSEVEATVLRAGHSSQTTSAAATAVEQTASTPQSRLPTGAKTLPCWNCGERVEVVTEHWKDGIKLARPTRCDHCRRRGVLPCPEPVTWALSRAYPAPGEREALFALPREAFTAAIDAALASLSLDAIKEEAGRTKLPFGKYKKKPIGTAGQSEVGRRYLQWCLDDLKRMNKDVRGHIELYLHPTLPVRVPRGEPPAHTPPPPPRPKHGRPDDEDDPVLRRTREERERKRREGPAQPDPAFFGGTPDRGASRQVVDGPPPKPPGANDEVGLPLEGIEADPAVQCRVGNDAATVQEYAEALGAGETLPPVVVFSDGQQFWLADGFHRLEAHRRAGRSSVRATIRSGGRRDAILYAAGANAAHGLRRSNADKRKAVETLLRDQEWSQWSDREIARRCGVCQPFVGKLRGELSENGYQMGGSRTVQRGGTTYQMNTGAINASQQDTGASQFPVAAGQQLAIDQEEDFKPEDATRHGGKGSVIPTGLTAEACVGLGHPSGASACLAEPESQQSPEDQLPVQRQGVELSPRPQEVDAGSDDQIQTPPVTAPAGRVAQLLSLWAAAPLDEQEQFLNAAGLQRQEA